MNQVSSILQQSYIIEDVAGLHRARSDSASRALPLSAASSCGSGHCRDIRARELILVAVSHFSERDAARTLPWLVPGAVRDHRLPEVVHALDDAFAEAARSPSVDVPDEQPDLDDIAGVVEAPFVEHVISGLFSAVQAGKRGGLHDLFTMNISWVSMISFKATLSTDRSSTVLARAPVDMGADCPVRPYQSKHRRPHVQGMQMPDGRGGRHAVLAVRVGQHLVQGLLVLPETGRKLEAGRAGELRARCALALEGFADAPAGRELASLEGLERRLCAGG